jgi:hypothetical protein
MPRDEPALKDQDVNHLANDHTPDERSEEITAGFPAGFVGELDASAATGTVAGEEDRLLCAAELDHRLIGRVGRVGLHEPPQDRLGGGGADADRGGAGSPFTHAARLIGGHSGRRGSRSV